MNSTQALAPAMPAPLSGALQNSTPREQTSSWPSCIRRSFTVIDRWVDAKLPEGLAHLVKRIIRAAPIIFALVYTQFEGPSFFVGLPIVVLLEKSGYISPGYIAPFRDGIGFSLLTLTYKTFLVFLKTHEAPLFAVAGILYFFSMVSFPSESAQEEELTILPPPQAAAEEQQNPEPHAVAPAQVQEESYPLRSRTGRQTVQ
jgi:hypothetical protein